MKIKYFFIFLCSLVVTSFSLYSYSNQLGSLRFEDDIFYLRMWKSKAELTFKLNEICMDEDGFMYKKIGDDKIYFLYGVDSKLSLTINPFNDNFCIAKYKNIQIINTPTVDTYGEGFSSSFIYFGIKQIVASSYHSENLRSGIISYSPELLKYLIEDDMDYTFYLQHRPWVAGKNNNENGIEEYLEIEFSKPCDNLVVLNGYVDFEKTYLYKANNRVKTFLVESLDEENPFCFEYTFEDYVHFSEIKLPAQVKNIRLTIKDVYAGNRWNDTCVTAVITNEF